MTGEDDYTVREGSVLSVADGSVAVRMERDEDCGGCRSCAVKALCRGRDSGHFELTALLPAGMRAAPGDRVTVAYRQANPATASLVLFLPALAGLFLGGLGGHALGRSDGMLLAGCLIGLLLGLGLTVALSRLGRLRADARVVERRTAGHPDEKV